MNAVSIRRPLTEQALTASVATGASEWVNPDASGSYGEYRRGRRRTSESHLSCADHGASHRAKASKAAKYLASSRHRLTGRCPLGDYPAS